MDYVKFTEKLLFKMHVGCIVVDGNNIPSEIDGGLRKMIFNVSDYSEILVNSLREAREKVVYRFFDEYACHYVFLKIPKKDRYFFAGPYISVIPEESFILKKAQKLNLTNGQIDEMKAYYRNLPVLEDENVLFSIIDTLGAFVFEGENNFTVEHIFYEIPDKIRPVYRSQLFDGENNKNDLSLEVIEQNYRNEKILMDAVSKGQINKVDVILSSLLNQGTEERLPDFLRNRKNYLIILNTLLRKAAEYGEVHPIHINRLSSEFAKKIEELFSVEKSLELQKEMMRKYCILVKEHSLKKYSQLIGRVITLISYDLSAPLTLKSIAEIMNVNASYLSATFKKECGETLTDYVNRKRMENAADILLRTDKQVQTVSEECGIFDVNYFIKIFKKHYGMSPTKFRQTVNL